MHTWRLHLLTMTMKRTHPFNWGVSQFLIKVARFFSASVMSPGSRQLNDIVWAKAIRVISLYLEQYPTFDDKLTRSDRDPHLHPSIPQNHHRPLLFHRQTMSHKGRYPMAWSCYQLPFRRLVSSASNYGQIKFIDEEPLIWWCATEFT